MNELNTTKVDGQPVNRARGKGPTRKRPISRRLVKVKVERWLHLMSILPTYLSTLVVDVSYPWALRTRNREASHLPGSDSQKDR